MARLVYRSLVFLLMSAAVWAEDGPPYPQMIPDEFMQPGFHPTLDEAALPQEMRNAISAYRSHIKDNQSAADALFEARDYQSQYDDAADRYSGHTSLPYEIMYPDPEAPRPAGGYPLVFTTYGRETLANVMALPEYRQQYPAYVVSILNTSRPGPLHAPPVHSPYAFLFLEFFDWLFEEYDIDQNRVYGSGWSRGGSSMTILTHAYASIHPDGKPLITAIVPSAGGFQNLEEQVVPSLLDVKILSLQSANDGNSNPRASEHAFDALEKAGAVDNIFWWIADEGHSPHNLGWQVREVVDWMFAQNKLQLDLRPDAILSIDNSDARVPLSFTADANASTANNGGSLSAYTWQIFKSREEIADYSKRYMHGYTIDTGFQGAEVIGTTASITHTIDEPGTYWLRVIVEDDDGNRRAATQEIQARSIIPTASFTFSRNHETVGRPINFDGSASVPEYEASLSSYAWDFGDGHSASGAQVSHAFAAAGDYTVSLTVTSSQGVTHTTTHVVSTRVQFPGYRYFRFVGLDVFQTWQSPRLSHFTFLAGSSEFPRGPMTSNVSQGITLEASWNPTNIWNAFDKDLSTNWRHHNYFLPGGWSMDVGEDQRFAPTGAQITMPAANSRWADFDIIASVDEVTWDTLWSHRSDDDGSLDPNGATVTFDSTPYIELSNVVDGTYGLGWEFFLQATTFHISDVTEVRYFANDTLIGSASGAAPHELLWSPNALGTYTLTAEATYASGEQTIATFFAVEVTIEPPPELTRIAIAPPLIALYPGSSATFSAIAYDQYDNALDPQPDISWSVSEHAGSIDASGSWTAGSLYGRHAVLANASHEAVELEAALPVRIGNINDPSIEYFADYTLRDIWEFIAKEPWEGASATVNRGTVTINSRGRRMWEGDNFFSAIRRTDITGDFDISVQVVSQNDNYTHDGSKVGILIANNFDDLSQGGYVSFHTRGNRRILLQSEGSTPGQISGSSSVNFSEEQDWPVWLRLVKSGTEFTGFYKFAEGDDWIPLGSRSVTTTAAHSQVALFASSNNDSETLSGTMTDFLVASSSLSRIIYMQRIGAQLWGIVDPIDHGANSDDGSLNPVPFGPLLPDESYILGLVPSSGQ